MRIRPRLTIRARLTLLYGAMFLLAGGLLLLLTFALVQQTLAGEIAKVPVSAGPPGTNVDPAAVPRQPSAAEQELLNEAGAEFRRVALRQIAIQGGTALVVTGLLSFGLGWLLAGRVLRPLHVITAQARELSESNLHSRIRLSGPRDELTDLADTLDGMLDRLQRAFTAHRHFIGNASHELRTPVAIARTAVDVLATRRAPTPAQIATAIESVREATRRSENLIEGLLTLTRSQNLSQNQEVVPLHDIVQRVLTDNVVLEEAGQLTVSCSLTPIVLAGDESLLIALVNNLVQNAFHYNRRGGTVDVRLARDGDDAVLTVANTGPLVPPEEVSSLVEPFRRAGTPRTSGSARGAGLGLSVVRAVSEAHGGAVRLSTRPAGGLEVTVTLPTVSGSRNPQPDP